VVRLVWIQVVTQQGGEVRSDREDGHAENAEIAEIAEV
jgi:hypothetical protein